MRLIALIALLAACSEPLVSQDCAEVLVTVTPEGMSPADVEADPGCPVTFEARGAEALVVITPGPYWKTLDNLERWETYERGEVEAHVWDRVFSGSIR